MSFELLDLKVLSEHFAKKVHEAEMVSGEFGITVYFKSWILYCTFRFPALAGDIYII